jgi:hypothetical protein
MPYKRDVLQKDQKRNYYHGHEYSSHGFQMVMVEWDFDFLPLDIELSLGKEALCSCFLKFINYQVDSSNRKEISESGTHAGL